MSSPSDILEKINLDDVSQYLVHTVKVGGKVIGYVLTAPQGFFWLDKIHFVYSDIFHETVDHAIAEFKEWVHQSHDGEMVLN